MVTSHYRASIQGSSERVGCSLGRLSQNGHLGRLAPPFFLARIVQELSHGLG